MRIGAANLASCFLTQVFGSCKLCRSHVYLETLKEPLSEAVTRLKTIAHFSGVRRGGVTLAQPMTMSARRHKVTGRYLKSHSSSPYPGARGSSHRCARLERKGG